MEERTADLTNERLMMNKNSALLNLVASVEAMKRR